MYKRQQLELARRSGKEVYSEFGFSLRFIKKPIIAVCGSYGRSTVAHMIGFILKQENKATFVGGNSDKPLIEYCLFAQKDEVDYVIVECSALQLHSIDSFHPVLVVFTSISDRYHEGRFHSVGEYIETKLKIIKALSLSLIHI